MTDFSPNPLTSRRFTTARMLSTLSLFGLLAAGCAAQPEPSDSTRSALTTSLADCQSSSLIAAINAANADGAGPHTINLKCGCTYTLTAIDNYWFGANALPPISSNITIDGGQGGAIIERSTSAPNMRLFYIAGLPTPTTLIPSGSLTLSNVTLRNGIAQGGNGGGNGGGGMGAGGAIFAQGNLTLSRTTLYNNTARGGAGGGNMAPVGGGGGMYGNGLQSGGGGGMRGAGSTTNGGDFLGGEGGHNDGTGGSGSGSFDGQDGANKKGGNSGGTNNLGGTGGIGGAGTTGGIAGDGGGGGSSVLSMGTGGGGGAGLGGKGGRGFGSTIGGGGGGFGGGGGPGHSGGGGGVGGGGGAPSGSVAGGGGGGFGGGGGRNAMGGFGGGGGTGGQNSLFGGGNNGGGGAGFGGGVFMWSGTLTVVNSTMTQNQAIGGVAPNSVSNGNGFGGAVFLLNGRADITNSTLAGNVVSAPIGTSVGGSMYILSFGVSSANSTVVLRNSIFADSVDAMAATAGDIALLAQTGTASLDVSTKNIVEGSINFAGAGASVTGTAIMMDPKLDVLQDNGGPTQTKGLISGSVAIGAGDGATCTNSATNSLDQRGAPRTTTCAIGAFEPIVLATNGSACTQHAECASLHCIDGFCCNTSCGCGDNADCQSCSGAMTGGANGVCLPTSAGVACRNRVMSGDGATCDMVEVCDGSSTVCPPDLFLPSGTTCRGSAGSCDVVETCSGTSAACPSDTVLPSSTVCRTAAGICDLAENCTGSSGVCPADARKTSSAVCRSSGGPCDVAEMCDGSSIDCPADAVRQSGFVCKAAGVVSPICDPQDLCDGRTKLCPMNFAKSGTACENGKTCAGNGVCR